ncbi:cell division protein FtsZ [Roseococcus sp. SYP-B2431]|uniref:cell division protein FtsZ n=1 Tax=Roseococcus sp. SYP-B2431 TaxID=2496640 RepID=UPI00103976AE|nr:cell division protein FtsZ [Roseococcus sp. SYP-B2431]TCH97515.1 cell division protein FtsZ [Roseococcus sp. SYP-B2431]
MTLNLTLPVTQHTDFSPRIAVIGVGGGGTNAVNNMINLGLDGVEFIVANTDAQALVNSRSERRVQLGPHLTQGLGAGAKPEIGRAAAEEATDELARHLEGCHMVFVTAGMGGGTGTGAAPVIARMARERGILTVGVVTKPFDFEGPKRKRSADLGLEELQSFVDTLIVIPNQNLFRLANERTTFAEAFKMADNVLYMGVRGVTDLMVNPGIVNLDFADIRTIMAEMGKAMMGTGEAEGEDRAVKAAEAAISNPLLEDTSMRGAKGVLINITGGLDMTLFEVDEAAMRIRREVDEDANIIFGSSIDENMNGRVRVSVVATGIDLASMGAVMNTTAAAAAAGPRLAVVNPPVAAAPAPAAPARPAAGPLGAPTLPAAPRRPVQVGGAGLLRQPAATAMAPAPAPEPQQYVYAEQMPQPQMVQPAPMPAPMPPQPQLHQPSLPEPGQVGGQGAGWRGLFRNATGLMRRNMEPEAPAAPRAEPSLATQPTRQPRPAQPQPDEMGLDIPTFLRRQSN